MLGEILGATNWVGAMNRSTEGSFVQLQDIYVLAFGPQFARIGAVLCHVAHQDTF